MDRLHKSSVRGNAAGWLRRHQWRRVQRSFFAFAAISCLAAGCTAPEPVTPSPTVPTSAASSATPVSTPSDVPAPSGGTTAQVVPKSTMTTAAPIGLKQTSAANKVEVSLTSLAKVNVQGRGPGEISGPAVAVTVRVRNGASAPLDLDHVIVNLLDAKGQLATPMTGDPAAPFQGKLAAGAGQSAVYVFSVAASALKPVQISVTYDVEAPTVLFKGNL